MAGQSLSVQVGSASFGDVVAVLLSEHEGVVGPSEISLHQHLRTGGLQQQQHGQDGHVEGCSLGLSFRCYQWRDGSRITTRKKVEASCNDD